MNSDKANPPKSNSKHPRRPDPGPQESFRVILRLGGYNPDITSARPGSRGPRVTRRSDSARSASTAIGRSHQAGSAWCTSRADRRRPTRQRPEELSLARTVRATHSWRTERSGGAARSGTTRAERRANGAAKCHCCAFPSWTRSASAVSLTRSFGSLSVEVLQKIVCCQFDLLVPPFRGTVVAGDQPHTV